jgi:hypothetical protein
MQAAARVLACQSHLFVAEGRRDEAVASALAIFRLSRHCGRNPTATSYLVAITLAGIAADCANGALQAGPVSSKTRAELDAELARQDSMDGFLWAIKSERAYVLASFQEQISAQTWIAAGFWKRQEPECLDVFDAFLAMARSPLSWHNAELRIGDMKPAKSSFLVGQQVSACEAYYLVALRKRAIVRSLRVLNALQARGAVGGKTPGLAELGLPAEATIDPFSGEPLHVKRLPHGYLVYSVGQNLCDDGGKVEDPTKGDVGFGPPQVTDSREPAKK